MAACPQGAKKCSVLTLKSPLLLLSVLHLSGGDCGKEQFSRCLVSEKESDQKGNRNWFLLRGVLSLNGRTCSASYVALACQEHLLPGQLSAEMGLIGDSHREPRSQFPTVTVQGLLCLLCP